MRVQGFWLSGRFLKLAKLLRGSAHVEPLGVMGHSTFEVEFLILRASGLRSMRGAGFEVRMGLGLGFRVWGLGFGVRVRGGGRGGGAQGGCCCILRPAPRTFCQEARNCPFYF